MTNAITVSLSSYNMGDVSEADFDSWAAYVTGHLDDATGFECSVDQRRFGEAGEDIIGGATDDQRETVKEALRSLWDSFCADDSAWPSKTDDTAPDGYRVFRGRDVNQVRADGSALDPHAWYYEPSDYEGDVVFDAGFATRAEAEQAARNHGVER